MDKLSLYVLILIISYPFIVGILFSLSYFIYLILYSTKGSNYFNKHQFFLYTLFLSIFFITIFFLSLKIGIFSKMGIIIKIDSIKIMFFIISIIVGIGIYEVERILSIFIQKFIRNNLSFLSIKNHNKQKVFHAFYIMILLSIIISFCEEFIWRSYLITYLKDVITIWPALILSSILFGINHYYFGVQAIILKSVTGIILGILYLTSGNVWSPFLTHTVFNIYVCKKGF